MEIGYTITVRFDPEEIPSDVSDWIEEDAEPGVPS